MPLRLNVFLSCALLLLPCGMPGEPVSVRYLEGSVHGYLALRSLDGKLLAAADLVQVAHEDQLTSHLIYRFKDGSIDEETAVFTQHGHFRLISDHHVQRGPMFPTPVDVTIKASTGEVTVRYQAKDQRKVETSHFAGCTEKYFAGCKGDEDLLFGDFSQAKTVSGGVKIDHGTARERRLVAG